MGSPAAIAALLPAACVCASAFAQGGPARGVRVVVPYPPGGGIDILARQLAEKFSPLWGQPVVVENRPGGSTIPGTDAGAKATPDGHTLLLTTHAPFSINPHLFAKRPYGAQRDFIPVT